MLRELWIENYALIEKAHIVFQPGFTVLTGETGSGKSLVVGALDLVLGARTRQDTVRRGAQCTFVAARFDPVPTPLEDHAEDGMLLISRTISAAGKSKVTLNDRPATLRRLREVGAHLADLHGQHEQQTILRMDTHRRLLDAYSQGEAKLDAYRMCREQYREAQTRLSRFLEDARRGSEEREFWSYQLAELKACHPALGQEEELQGERRRIGGAAKLEQALGESRAALDGGPESVAPQLNLALQALEEAAKVEPTLDTTLSQLEEARVLVEDAARDLAGYQDTLHPDPDRLDAVEERLANIAALRRKHKTDEAGLLELQAELQERLDVQANAEHLQRELEEQLQGLGETWVAAARALTKSRTRGATRLSKDINTELRCLGMGEAGLRVMTPPVSQGDSVGGRMLGSHGAEDVAFHLIANPGEPGGPLASIASGGELSRVMLALKNVLRRVDPVPVVLFDEVDAGIGGMVAEAVGERLAQIADNRQVIVVTHSALIAGMAHHHLRLSKESGERTSVSVDTVTGDDREQEIARMLAGSAQEAARATAQTILRDQP